MSQEELAYRAKVHRTYMAGIERGKHNPSLDVIERIADSLGVAPSVLMSEAEATGKRRRA